MELSFDQLPELSFDHLPAAVTQLCKDMAFVKQLLQQKYEPQKQTDQWFDLVQFCDYHPEKPAKATVYGWVNAYTVPFYKKGKKLFFLKSEIDTWLKAGRKKTLTEIASEADKYLSNKKPR